LAWRRGLLALLLMLGWDATDGKRERGMEMSTNPSANK
jgi:hypothetical protein